MSSSKKKEPTVAELRKTASKMGIKLSKDGKPLKKAQLKAAITRRKNAGAAGKQSGGPSKPRKTSKKKSKKKASPAGQAKRGKFKKIGNKRRRSETHLAKAGVRRGVMRSDPHIKQVSSDALLLVTSVVEFFVMEVLEKAMGSALHASRVTVMIKDLTFSSRLCGDRHTGGDALEARPRSSNAEARLPVFHLAALRRVGHLAGVKRIGKKALEEVAAMARAFLNNLITKAAIFMKSNEKKKRVTLSRKDVVEALRVLGMKVY